MCVMYDYVSKERLFGVPGPRFTPSVDERFPNQAIVRNCYCLRTQEKGSVPSDPIATDDVILDMQNLAHSHNFGRDGMLQFGDR